MVDTTTPVAVDQRECTNASTQDADATFCSDPRSFEDNPTGGLPVCADCGLPYGRKQEPSRPVGRPTEYDESYPQKMYDYFNRQPTTKRKKVIFAKNGNEYEIEEDVATEFPTLAGFAVSIMTHRDTLKEWSEAVNHDGTLKFPEFSVVYKMAKSFQESILVPNAAAGRYSAQFSAFFAKNHLGYIDKTEVDANLKGQLDLVSIHKAATDAAAGKNPPNSPAPSTSSPEPNAEQRRDTAGVPEVTSIVRAGHVGADTPATQA